MTESAYSKLTFSEAAQLELTLTGLRTGMFAGLEHVEVTVDLARPCGRDLIKMKAAAIATMERKFLAVF